MKHRSFRAPVVAGLLLTMLAGVRAAHAQGADAGAPTPPAPTVTVSPDGGAPPPAETGGGLFEQSQATAATAAPAAEASASTPPFTLNGYARGDVFIGKIPDVDGTQMKANYGELALQLRTAKVAYGDGFADLRVRYGLMGDQQGTFVDMREAYVNTYLGPVDLRLGKQIIVWGRADALNPTNNITPVDFRLRSPLEDDIRLGNVGARGFLRMGVARLEGVWMPTYLPTELPPVQLPPLVSFASPIFPSANLHNGLVAGRAHLELAAFDMSISYLRGFAPLPGLALSTVTFNAVTPGIGVSRTAYKQQVIGFDFSTALGDIATIRGEAAYRRPVDYQNYPNSDPYDPAFNPNPVYLARPDLQYVVGADHNFGSFNVIAQYLGRYVFDWQKEPGTMRDPTELEGILRDPSRQVDFMEFVVDEVSNELRQINQILYNQTAKVQHVATLRLEWLGLHETLSISSLAMVNFTTHEWLVTPRIGWKMTDTMTAYVGAQVFAGPDDTLFGLIDQTLSAGYAELRASF